MQTQAIRPVQLSYLSNVAQALDNFAGAVLTVKPSVLAASFGEARDMYRLTNGEDRNVTRAQLQKVRSKAGLSPL